jgi:hypothetical protein
LYRALTSQEYSLTVSIIYGLVQSKIGALIYIYQGEIIIWKDHNFFFIMLNYIRVSILHIELQISHLTIFLLNAQKGVEMVKLEL